MIDAGFMAREEASLIRLYQRAEQRLTTLVRTMSKTEFQRNRAASLLMQVRQIISQLDAGQLTWMEQQLPRAYRAGMNWAGDAIGQDPRAFTLIHRQAVEAVARDLSADSQRATASVVDRFQAVFIHSQQAVAREAQVMEQIGAGLIEGLGPRELSKRIVQTLQDGALSRLAEAGLSEEVKAELSAVAQGQYIKIRCKDGKDRNYKLRPYGETIARTATRQASTEGVLMSCQEFGMDLVQWSVHAGACPLCIPIQGKVFSISGNTQGFPILTAQDRPPFHPCCEHVLLPVSEAFLRARGLYEKLQAFSSNPERSVTRVKDYQEMLRAA